MKEKHTQFRKLRDAHFEAEDLTPEGFDAYVNTVCRYGKRYKEAINEGSLEALKRYIFEGYRPGHFLTAVLCNDLMEACGRANEDNAIALPWYCGILYNYMPSALHGGKEKVNAWVELCWKAGEEEYAEKNLS